MSDGITKSQGYELIGIAWLAMAAFDDPFDVGTLVYLALCLVSFIRAARSVPAPAPSRKEDAHV